MFSQVKKAVRGAYDVIDHNTGAITTVVGTTVATLSTNLMAADYTALTDAVDFADVITAMIAVAGFTALLYVAWKGIGMILGAIKR